MDILHFISLLKLERITKRTLSNHSLVRIQSKMSRSINISPLSMISQNPCGPKVHMCCKLHFLCLKTIGFLRETSRPLLLFPVQKTNGFNLHLWETNLPPLSPNPNPGAAILMQCGVRIPTNFNSI